MWCKNCQHGHEPIQVFDELRQKVVGKCPCCGAKLEPETTKTPEELVIEMAAKYGLEVNVKPKEKGFVVGEKSHEFKEEIREKSVSKSK